MIISLQNNEITDSNHRLGCLMAGMTGGPHENYYCKNEGLASILIAALLRNSLLEAAEPLTISLPPRKTPYLSLSTHPICALSIGNATLNSQPALNEHHRHLSRDLP
jgi:hypothetical protein